MDTKKIGKFISENRKRKGLTQEQLGELLGVTNKTISRWENGENQPLIAKMNRSICTNNGKSFGFWLRFPSFPTRYIGKMIFFFRVL